MILRGDVPVGVMNDLYYRLNGNGIEIEDFIVDSVNNQVQIITNIKIDESTVLELLKDESSLDVAISYVSDIADEGALSRLKNYLLSDERIFKIIGHVVASSVVGGMAGLLAGVTTDVYRFDVAVVAALISGIYLWIVRDK